MELGEVFHGIPVSQVLSPYDEVYKADSGAITFTTIDDQPYDYWYGKIYLIGKECPHKIFYEIHSNGPSIILVKDAVEIIHADNCETSAPRKYWLSWYNNTINLGTVMQSKKLKPFFVYEETCSEQNPKQQIGFISIKSVHVTITLESCPLILKSMLFKSIAEEHELRWVKMTGRLPENALIGGFENEPIYTLCTF